MERASPAGEAAARAWDDLRRGDDPGAAALLDVLERELRPLRPNLAWRAVEAVRLRLSAAG